MVAPNSWVALAKRYSIGCDLISTITCLDLFAGSGALGFEAASNGAHSVTFVESSRAAAKALSANIQQLNAETATFIQPS